MNFSSISMILFSLFSLAFCAVIITPRQLLGGKMTAAGLPSAPGTVTSAPDEGATGGGAGGLKGKIPGRRAGGNSHIGSEVMDKVTKGLVRGGLPGVSMITESVEKGLKAGGL